MKDYVKNNIEAVEEWLEGLDDHELMQTYNEYARENHYEEIYSNDDEFFELFYPNTIDAVRAVCFGEYDYQDDYVRIDGLANLETTNNVEDFVDMQELAQHVYDNPQLYDIELEDEDEEE